MSKTDTLTVSSLCHVCVVQFCVCVVLMAALSVSSVVLVPPAGLPDLFPVLVSSFSYLTFLGCLIYFNLVQLTDPPSWRAQKKSN